jgi:hypothetical protein
MLRSFVGSSPARTALSKSFPMVSRSSLVTQKSRSISSALPVRGLATRSLFGRSGMVLGGRDEDNRRKSPLVHYQQARHLLHIPLLGLLTPKVLAALAVKKTVVVAVLQKYGIKGTFDILRATNDQLGTQLGGAAYPPAARAAVKAGLDALESSVAKLDSKEQVDIVYKWISALDPSLLVEAFKNYVSTNPAPEPADTPEDKTEKLAEIKLIKEIGDRFPEVARKYHIVLVQRDEEAEREGKKHTEASGTEDSSSPRSRAV